MRTYHDGSLSIVPLLGWYDYSFGQPNTKLKETWMDFRTCAWPSGYQLSDITKFFVNQNAEGLKTKNDIRISFSHFLPRIDLMPVYIPYSLRYLYPVLGSSLLEKQIRILKPFIHIYGHSHVNQQTIIDNVKYVNNAFGYPHENRICEKKLLCIYQR
jgi:hypothetical protein